MSEYSIVITTFDKRFQECLVPLVNAIKSQRPDMEIIVMVNGRANDQFNENYRRELLAFLSTQTNCFPSIFTNFQSLAKMWNRGILTASHDHVLVVNDDITIEQDSASGFFDCLDTLMKSGHNTFKLNGSFSHFMVHKPEVIQVGFFDERLLGIGEEDGDFTWRYYQVFQREIPSLDIQYLVNTGSDQVDEGFVKGIRQYSKFNRDFIKQSKYERALLGGYKGMFDHRVKKVLPDEKQYPYEDFYRQNKHKV
jgi:hypothetical protein